MSELSGSLINSTDIYALASSYSFELNQEEKSYLNNHAKRLAYFVNITKKYTKIILDKKDTPVKIMDIGPHFLTFALHKYLGNSISLNTLGWENNLAPPNIVNHHLQFDLNNAQHEDKWLPAKTHDIVIMCEVIEHLYTAPELVLSFVKTFISPGGFLIVGTPNAAYLPNRVLLASGRNPYEMIRKTYNNPGHFREYTASEFKKICQEVGLRCESIEYQDFSENRGIAHRIVRSMGNIHQPFKKYLSIVCQN